MWNRIDKETRRHDCPAGFFMVMTDDLGVRKDWVETQAPV